MFLNPGFRGPKLNLLTEHITTLIGFVSQSRLEKTLYNLKIKDRGRAIYFEDFDGQLELDSSALTTLKTALPFEVVYAFFYCNPLLLFVLS
jgi:hypothetical protein